MESFPELTSVEWNDLHAFQREDNDHYKSDQKQDDENTLQPFRVDIRKSGQTNTTDNLKAISELVTNSR